MFIGTAEDARAPAFQFILEDEKTLPARWTGSVEASVVVSALLGESARCAFETSTDSVVWQIIARFPVSVAFTCVSFPNERFVNQISLNTDFTIFSIFNLICRAFFSLNN